MNYNELNKYIKHYLDCDKTQRAIMLSAEWGTGKSHYIQNELIPYLQKEENGKHQCIVISLYGLKDVSEISKMIYIDARMHFFNKDSEGHNWSKVATKTIIKGVASFLNVDLSVNNDDLQSLYESINLTGKLVILEDIERSEIDILSILGYANNLAEQGDAKILLVSNEQVFLNYEYSEPDKEGNRKKYLDKASAEYVTTKEKTISDTISFCCDYGQAIKTIISKFTCPDLDIFTSDKGIEDIISIMTLRNSFNLRTFTYACQKSADLLQCFENNNEDFIKNIFYSIFSFSIQIKNGVFPPWSGNELVSSELGISTYPLYRFCYDYIRWQEFNENIVKETLEEHKNLVLYNQKVARNDPDLKVIFSFFTNSEHDVLNALKNIENRLNSSDSVPFFSYPQLAYYLIKCHNIIDFDYTACKEKMITNVSGKNDKIDPNYFYYPFSEDEDESTKELIRTFINELKTSLMQKNFDESFFSYESCEFEKLYYSTAEKKRTNQLGHAFISKFDIDKLTQLLLSSHPNHILFFRDNIALVYNHSMRIDFLEEDIDLLIEFKNMLISKTHELDPPIDRIVLYQINLLIKELSRYIDKLA